MDTRTLALNLDRAAPEALYQQLTASLASAIGAGDLAPGERLPSERDLAARLAISRTTAVNAYRELEARGLVRGHVGRGTFVCAPPEHSGAPFAWQGKVALAAQRVVEPSLRSLVRHDSGADVVSFVAAMPALDLFPTETVRAITGHLLLDGPAAFGLGPTEGLPKLRRAIARRCRLRPEQTLVVTGSQQGLDLIARCLLDPGDTVILDRPGYLGALQLFRSVGARLVGWDVARYDLNELEDLLLRYRPKLLYVNPTFQNPTNRTLSLPDRRDLLDLAARYHVPIIEDEPCRELWFDAPPPPSLRELDDTGSVIHVSTFSKTLAPGLRLGWIGAAEAIVQQLALVKGRSDVASSSLEQLIVAELLANGAYDAHLATLRREHARRHAAAHVALRALFPPELLSVGPTNGGLVLWGKLGGGLEAAELLPAATAAGVAFVPGDAFYPDAQSGRHELRLAVTGLPPERIELGLRRLAGVVDAAARHGRGLVGTRVVK